MECCDLDFTAELLVGQGRNGEIFLADPQQKKLHKFFFKNDRFHEEWSMKLPSCMDPKCLKHVSDSGHLLIQQRDAPSSPKATLECKCLQKESECVQPQPSHWEVTHVHENEPEGDFVACLSGDRYVYKYKSGSQGHRAIRVVCILQDIIVNLLIISAIDPIK